MEGQQQSLNCRQNLDIICLTAMTVIFAIISIASGMLSSVKTVATMIISVLFALFSSVSLGLLIWTILTRMRKVLSKNCIVDI